MLTTFVACTAITIAAPVTSLSSVSVLLNYNIEITNSICHLIHHCLRYLVSRCKQQLMVSGQVQLKELVIFKRKSQLHETLLPLQNKSGKSTCRKLRKTMLRILPL